ncbi:MAG: hypothetical protein ACKPKO_23410, partial [Candidatus Fonsibacter sp.]
RRAAHLAHAIAKNVAQGSLFEPVSHEEHRARQKSNMVVPADQSAASVLSELSPDEVISHWLEYAESHRRTSIEGVKYSFMVESFFTPKFTPKPKDQMSIASVIRRYSVDKGDGWQWCMLCGKYITEAHTTMDSHTMAVSETAAIDEMVSICTSARRFSPTAGLTTGLNVKDFKLSWGEYIDEMPKILLDRINSGTSIKVPLSGWGKRGRVLKKDDILSVGMDCASYPGQGKYHTECATSERALRW